MARIFIIGSVNQDIVVNADRAPRGGETVIADGLQYHPGGKGANQAVGASLYSKLNNNDESSVTFIGRVGDDAFGRSLTDYLQTRGLNTQLTIEQDAPTGTAVIVVERDGENRILVIPGANGRVNEDDCQALEELRSDDFVVAQCEIPLEAVRYAFSMARAVDATTILNVAPAVTLGSDWFELIDVLVVNRSEFDIVFPTAKSGDLDSDLVKAHRESRCDIVLTLGEHGAIAISGGQIMRCEGIAVESVDSTGAGDCFVGAMVARLAAGEPLQVAIGFATRAAANSVTRRGASESYPSCDQLL
ncbi:MAG: ribokinase [Planctomycetales bacterium]|nr:ribokinase [Planctomycetales bacterium]